MSCPHEIRLGPNPERDAAFEVERSHVISQLIKDIQRKEEIKMKTVRCKLFVESVKQFGQNQEVTQEEIQFRAISSGKQNADGVSEDNTFSKYTPSADFRMTVTNPALFGFFKPGKKLYVDMTEAET